MLVVIVPVFDFSEGHFGLSFFVMSYLFVPIDSLMRSELSLGRQSRGNGGLKRAEPVGVEGDVRGHGNGGLSNIFIR